MRLLAWCDVLGACSEGPAAQLVAGLVVFGQTWELWDADEAGQLRNDLPAHEQL